MNPHDDAFPTLARLIAPVPVSQFLAQHWESAYLRVPARDRGPDAREVPITLAELDAVLMDRPHMHPHVQLVDAARAVAVEEYTHDDDVVDPVRAVKRFSAGATMIVNRIDEWAPRVRELFERGCKLSLWSSAPVTDSVSLLAAKKAVTAGGVKVGLVTDKMPFEYYQPSEAAHSGAKFWHGDKPELVSKQGATTW